VQILDGEVIGRLHYGDQWIRARRSGPAVEPGGASPRQPARARQQFGGAGAKPIPARSARTRASCERLLDASRSPEPSSPGGTVSMRRWTLLKFVALRPFAADRLNAIHQDMDSMISLHASAIVAERVNPARGKRPRRPFRVPGPPGPDPGGLRPGPGRVDSGVHGMPRSRR